MTIAFGYGAPDNTYDDHISNPGRDDYWTCPACIHDLGDVGEGDHDCPNCGRTVTCTIEHEPACHSRLEGADT